MYQIADSCWEVTETACDKIAASVQGRQVEPHKPWFHAGKRTTHNFALDF